MSLEYSIFKPGSKREIFNDYPDLRKYEAFASLDNNSMLFVWYYACESSPFFSIERDRERVEKAVEKAYYKSGRKKLSDSDFEKMKAGQFSTKLSTAITEMKRFKVGPRVRALMVIEKGFSNLSEIINVDINDKKIFENEDGEIDFSKYKAYVETVSKSVDLMPKMINQLEGRFNLKEDKASGQSTFEGESLMDSYHENQD